MRFEEPARRASDLMQVTNLFKLAIATEDHHSTRNLRNKYLKEAFTQGGKPLVERVRKYGRTERGIDHPVDMTPWFSEYIEALGDLRIAEKITLGCSQVGKTLGHTLVSCDLGTFGRFNIGWFYSTGKALQMNMPRQFRPVIEAWLEVAESDGYEFAKKNERRTNEAYTIGGVNYIFSYVSTSRTTASGSSGSGGSAAAGGAAVSFTADSLIEDERSQYPPGAAAPLPRRLDASVIPTRPLLITGTPGGGSGIEMELQSARRHFYPHYECPHCGAIAPLDPKGVLLKPYVHPRKGVSFLSESGKPVTWFHHDENKSIETAYFGCSECGEELPDSVRHNALFKCRETGIWLREYLDKQPSVTPEEARHLPRQRIAIYLSPLIRGTREEAGLMIQEGLDSENADDWQQQRLGHPSESTENRLTLETLKNAIAAPPPDRKSSVILAGIDQGRGQYWLWVASYHLPEFWHSKPVEQVIINSQRRVIFAGPILKGDIAEKLEQYHVNFGLIDNEPERTEAAEIQRVTCLAAADQKSTQRDAIVKGIVKDGGEMIDCWFLRNQKFLKQVLVSYVTLHDDGYPLTRLPSDWTKWISNNSELSPIKHLMGPSFDPDSGKWERGPKNLDDMYYANMFAEAAFYLWLTDPSAAQTHVLARGSLGMTKRIYAKRKR